MRACIQRVSRASVTVDRQVVGQIKQGLLLLIGIAEGDREREAEYLADKVARLRIFDDASGKMNRSLLDVGGAALLVSQFTLLADCRRGRRPSYISAARPELAEQLYLHFAKQLRSAGLHVETGHFGAHMDVELVNDGPVTIVLDSE